MDWRRQRMNEGRRVAPVVVTNVIMLVQLRTVRWYRQIQRNLNVKTIGYVHSCLFQWYLICARAMLCIEQHRPYCRTSVHVCLSVRPSACHAVIQLGLSWWRSGLGVGLSINRSWVRFPAGALSRHLNQLSLLSLRRRLNATRKFKRSHPKGALNKSSVYRIPKLLATVDGSMIIICLVL